MALNGDKVGGCEGNCDSHLEDDHEDDREGSKCTSAGSIAVLLCQTVEILSAGSLAQSAVNVWNASCYVDYEERDKYVAMISGSSAQLMCQVRRNFQLTVSNHTQAHTQIVPIKDAELVMGA